MAVDGNINNLVNTIVQHPAFIESINAILSVSSSVISAIVQTENRTANVSSPIGGNICNTDRNRRRFDSPAQELSTIFRRGGNLTFQHGINTGLEDLYHIKEQQQQYLLALSAEIKSL